MNDYDAQRSGGFPVLVLIGLSCCLAWLFSNPYLGFVLVFIAGIALLGGVEYARRRWKANP
jgi:hypothetical protein